MKYQIHCGTLILADHVESNVYLVLDGASIRDIAHKPQRGVRTLNASEFIVAPGFIDIHVHGGMGADTMDASVKSLRTMARFFAAHGVTSFLPTTMTALQGDITKALKAVGRSLLPLPPGEGWGEGRVKGLASSARMSKGHSSTQSNAAHNHPSSCAPPTHASTCRGSTAVWSNSSPSLQRCRA